MVSDKHGLKDQASGKFKEIKGRLTGNKQEEEKGRAQNVLGKAKDKITDIKDSLTDKKE